MHRCIGGPQAPLDQLHRPRGNDRLCRRWLTAVHLTWALHLRQPPAVGAYGDHQIARQFQEHAPEGVAARFVVGCEDRPPDELPHERCRDLEARAIRKAAHGRKLERILHRQAKFTPRCLEHRCRAVAVNLEQGAGWTLAENRPQSSTRKQHGSFSEGLYTGEIHADAQLEIRRRDEGSVRGGLKPDIREDWLRRTGRHDGCRSLHGSQQGFLRATDFHAGKNILKI